MNWANWATMECILCIVDNGGMGNIHWVYAGLEAVNHKQRTSMYAVSSQALHRAFIYTKRSHFWRLCRCPDCWLWYRFKKTTECSWITLQLLAYSCSVGYWLCTTWDAIYWPRCSMPPKILYWAPDSSTKDYVLEMKQAWMSNSVEMPWAKAHPERSNKLNNKWGRQSMTNHTQSLNHNDAVTS